MPLFDTYLMVDWSASNKPKCGKDSIWIACGERHGNRTQVLWNRNIPTRSDAVALIAELMAESIRNGRRMIAGFDFAFGYPQGAAERMAGEADWRAVWRHLEAEVVDDDRNRSNRFAVAAKLNESLGQDCGARFWGNGTKTDFVGLERTKKGISTGKVPERRQIENRLRGAKTVWQLSGAGAVGSQTLLGIAALERLRSNEKLKNDISIWPFETGFDADLSKSIVVAEIYPSLLPIAPISGEVADAAQMRTVVETFAGLDLKNELRQLLAMPDCLSREAANAVQREEGWIVGATTLSRKNALSLVEDSVVKSASTPIRDPAEIYRRSFAIIQAEADLARFGADTRSVVVRMIHACGMVDLADDIIVSDGFARSARTTLEAGAPVLCDAEMVRHGIITRLMPAGNEVMCLLNEPQVREIAARDATTRSAAQVDLWAERMGGAVIAIGNAPTALFRLLELIDAGAPKPAAIIGIPVGFVGAAESKEALAADPRGVEFLTVRGRRGGSALASAAVNAIAGGLEGHG